MAYTDQAPSRLGTTYFTLIIHRFRLLKYLILGGRVAWHSNNFFY